MNQLHVIPLRGCFPDPLGNYLKALGVFRIIAEQADPQVRGWWKDGCLWLMSQRLGSVEELVEWVKEEYRPSPIPAPWYVNSGWWPPENQPPPKGDKRDAPYRAFRALCSSDVPRFRPFKDCRRDFLDSFESSLALPDKTPDLPDPLRKALAYLQKQDTKLKQKANFHRRLRNSVADRMTLRWLDAVGSPKRSEKSPLSFFPLLADGGGEGVNSFVGNFYQRLVEHLPTTKPAEDFWRSDEGRRSAARLRVSLSGEAEIDALQKDAAGGLYYPALVEAPNVGQKFTSTHCVNPWDFIFTIEGTLVWSSAISRRCDSNADERPSFPFFCDSSLGGAQNLGPAEVSGYQEAKARGELWCPLWERPALFPEVEKLLSEGRVQIGRDYAQTATEFALGVSSLGVDRGITVFLRVGLLKRGGSGNQTTTLAVNLGQFPPKRLRYVELLNRLRPYHRMVSRTIQHHEQMPRRIVMARTRMEEAVFEFLGGATETENSHEHKRRLLAVLTTTAVLEREIGITAGEAELKKKTHPIPPLRLVIGEDGQNKGCPIDDGSPEFRLALAIGSLAPWGERIDGRFAVEAMRGNLLPLVRRGSSWQWDKYSRSSVWARGTSLAENLSAVLRRRFIDAEKGEGGGLPLWAWYGASFQDLVAFWHGELDERRIEELIYALALIEWSGADESEVDRVLGRDDVTPDFPPSAVWVNEPGRAHARWPHIAGIPPDEIKACFQLPRSYCLLKLCFLGGKLPARPVQGRISRRNGDELYPPFAPEIVNLLLAGRGTEALHIAATKLQAKGYPSVAPSSTFEKGEFGLSIHECRRLAGMLLIPVRRPGLLASLAIKPRLR